MTQLPEHIPTISQQARLFLGSCLLGAPIGLLLDCFRMLRALLPHRFIAVFIEDTIFASTSILLLICYAATFGTGELRMYYAVGALLGLILYLLTIGTLTMHMAQKAHKFIHFICTRIQTAVMRFRSFFVKAYENRKKA